MFEHLKRETAGDGDGAEERASAISSRGGFAIAATALALAAFLAISVGSVLRQQSGPLMLVWIAVWCVAAGVVGHRLRRWLWVPVCPLLMIAIVMLWEIVYGRTSWASTYVFMLGVAYAVAATVGALSGVALGKGA